MSANAGHQRDAHERESEWSWNEMVRWTRSIEKCGASKFTDIILRSEERGLLMVIMHACMLVFGLDSDRATDRPNLI